MGKSSANRKARDGLEVWVRVALVSWGARIRPQNLPSNDSPSALLPLTFKGVWVGRREKEQRWDSRSHSVLCRVGAGGRGR